MQFFKRKAKSKSRLGLSVSSKSLALVYMEHRGDKPFLLRCSQFELASEKDVAKVLAKQVQEMDLQDTQCSYVLDRKDYNLHLVEAPEVEAEELRSAVRWKIKDLLDMKVEDAAIDVFPVPEDAYRGRKMVYVVASLKSRIRNIIETVTESGLELAVIDIPELAMHNLSSQFINDSRGIAFLDLRRNGSTMNISRGGQLYLSRQINTQMDPAVMQSFEWEGLKDKLVLEIQRSLDYYESQMSQGQISRIFIAQRQHDGTAMAAALNEELAAEVGVLDLAEHMDSNVELTCELQQISMAAIGATLRGGKKVEPKPVELEAAGGGS